ncbi:hypothetical protein [Alicyclobacillus sp. SP_1]|uniref:hypothetical protein n=1 Tax=Alicyclobacillus sp. SP_1 TaxID=2942475 RepID=UPI002157AAE1|nr:hypothetical protein [Alicyclobacillus sp. SP_1]
MMFEVSMGRDSVVFGMRSWVRLEVNTDEAERLLQTFLAVRKTLYLGGFLWVDLETFDVLIPEWLALPWDDERTHAARITQSTETHLTGGRLDAFRSEAQWYQRHMLRETKALVPLQRTAWRQALLALERHEWERSYEHAVTFLEAKAHRPWTVTEWFYLSALLSSGIAMAKLAAENR